MFKEIKLFVKLHSMNKMKGRLVYLTSTYVYECLGA